MGKIKIFLATLLMIVGFGATAQSASAKLDANWAAGKAVHNTWNVFCNADPAKCQRPGWDGWSRRINQWTVDVRVYVFSFEHFSYCWSYRRVYGHNHNSRILENWSGQYWCGF